MRNTPVKKGKTNTGWKCRKQMKLEVLMAKLPNLNFNNPEVVINWICELAKLTNCKYVKLDKKEILKIFAEHGYLPSMNIGEDCNVEDRDNFAHYVVGQALSWFKGVGELNACVYNCIDDWKKKFARQRS